MIRKLALGVLVVWILLSMAGQWLTAESHQMQIDTILHAPSWGNWLGTDDLGRSIAMRLIAGAGLSCMVALAVVSIGLMVGVTVGAIAGFVGGTTDRVIVYVIDVFLAFPGILLAIALAGVLGPGIDNVIIALCVMSWVGYARLVRAQVFSLREREHVQAARALGVTPLGVLFRHILPLTAAPIIVEATFAIASVVIAEAGLSFLGLGAQPPTASWGNMIRDGSQYLLVAPHMVLVPGVALMLVVISINLIGDQLRDFLDVKNQNTRR